MRHRQPFSWGPLNADPITDTKWKITHARIPGWAEIITDPGDRLVADVLRELCEYDKNPCKLGHAPGCHTEACGYVD